MQEQTLYKIIPNSWDGMDNFLIAEKQTNEVNGKIFEMFIIIETVKLKVTKKYQFFLLRKALDC